MELETDVVQIEFIAIAKFQPLSLIGLLHSQCKNKNYNIQLQKTIIHHEDKTTRNTQ